MNKLAIWSLTLLSTCSMAESWIEQELQQFLNKQQQLATQIDQYCDNADAEAPIASWRQAAGQWLVVQGLGLPAVDHLNQGYAYLQYPDRKDRLKKFVDPLLSLPFSQSSFDGLAISAKGLSAQEYLFSHPKPVACPYLKAISREQLGQVRSLKTLQKDQVVNEYTQVAALHHTTIQGQKRMEEALEKKGKVTRFFLPGWRSHSESALHLSAMDSLIRQGQRWHERFMQSDQTELANQVADFNQRLQQQLKQWPDRIEDLNQQPDPQALLQAHKQLLEHYLSWIESQLAPAEGVVLGFNNYDGD